MIFNYELEPEIDNPEIEVIPDTETPAKETPSDDPYDVPRPNPVADPEPKA